jgi:hypothetical protein
MSGFKRLLKRFVAGVLILLGVVALLAFGTREYLYQEGSGERDAVTRKLDADEPGWRLKDIQAARAKDPIPPERDATPFVLHTHTLGDAPWRPFYTQLDWEEYGKHTNHTPSFRTLVWLAAAREPTAVAREFARTNLVYRTAGRYPVTIGEIPYTTLLPHVDKVRFVYGLIEYDANLAALDGDPARGLLAARAALNAGRSIGDEPFLISQLVRMAGGGVSCRSAERVLAWNRPSGLPGVSDAELAALQAAFAEEADTPWLEYGLRGERAMANQLFEAIESGKISPAELARFVDSPNPSAFQSGAFRLYRGFLPGDHAECLRIMTAYLDAAKLPHHERRAALKSIKIPPGPPENFGVIITRLIVPACEKVGDSSLRVRGELLAASVGVACERFRLAHGRWPESLDEIPPAILPAIPIDPFTGSPIRYEHLADGISVFSVGPDGHDPPKHFTRQQTGPYHGEGVGWRLWNPELRGLPPEYRPPITEPEAPTDP